RHVALFCVDLLHAKRCAVLGPVQPQCTGESSGAEFHRARRRDYRGDLLSGNGRGRLPFSCDSARIWSRETISSEAAHDAAIGVDRSFYLVGRLFTASATVPFARLACRLQYPGTGRLDRIRLHWFTPQCSWPVRFAYPLDWSLCD